jgi:tetratricopeptide (TPR) repeat protein
MKQFPEAMADAKASIEIRVLTQGESSPLVATAYESLGRAQLALGDARTAAVTFSRALDLAVSDVVRARIHVLAAKTYADVNRPHDAYLHAKQAVELGTKTLGPEHPATLLYLYIEAVMLNKDGHRDQARALVEGVLPKLEASHADATVLAHARSLLARTLPKTQRTRALDLARSARAVLVTAGPSEKDSLDTLDAWLAHPEP